MALDFHVVNAEHIIIGEFEYLNFTIDVVKEWSRRLSTTLGIFSVIENRTIYVFRRGELIYEREGYQSDTAANEVNNTYLLLYVLFRKTERDSQTYIRMDKRVYPLGYIMEAIKNIMLDNVQRDYPDSQILSWGFHTVTIE